MDSQAASTPSELPAQSATATSPDGGLESVRTWFNFWTWFAALVGLVLVALLMNGGRGQPSGTAVLSAFVLAAFCRAFAVFAAALQRIERKLHGLPTDA